MGMAVLLADNTSTAHRLHVAFELSASKWKIGFTDGKTIRQVTIVAGDLKSLSGQIEKAKRRFGLKADAKTVSCYEAGRDGFWLHRWLESVGVESVIVEPASILVDRRARRAKTDRLDLEALLRLLLRFSRGERDVWRVVRVPSEDAEDVRRHSRERDRLKREEVQHRNRIRGLLALHGLRLAPRKGFREALAAARLWNEKPLPPALLAELLREFERLEFVQAQFDQIEDEHRARIKESARRIKDSSGKKTSRSTKKRPTKGNDALEQADRKILRLVELRGVGIVSATVLVHELFGWRTFNNRREVGAIAGLQGTPYQSGGPGREQGISKAGNPRVRKTMTELAWCWLRWQPESKLAKRFDEYVGNGEVKTKKRFRKVAIVALARQLLVALWHYLEHGVIPEGAVWSSAA
jgi:transposase